MRGERSPRNLYKRAHSGFPDTVAERVKHMISSSEEVGLLDLF